MDGRQTIDNYRNEETIPKEWIKTEYLRWRDVSGSTLYNIEQVDRVFNGLVATLMRFIAHQDTSKDDREWAGKLFDVVNTEHSMRQAYRITKPLRDLVG